MDAFKAQFERIKQQLAALTATQKMLVGALVAVMVLTMLYWGRYAGTAELVPVLDQALSADQMAPIVHQLDITGVPYQTDTGKVLVPADRKTEILAELMYAEVLPQDTSSAFETMSKQLNPFAMSSEREADYNHATEMELAQVIRQWKGVTNANVLINPKLDRHIGDTIAPSATVNIRTNGNAENPKQLVRAAADGVAHAVSGLMPSQISVIIDGNSMMVPDAQNDPLAGGDTEQDLRQRSESDLKRKIRSQFQDIPNLLVSVSCDVSNTTVNTTQTNFNKPGTLSLPNMTDDHSEETTTNSAGPTEPGVESNTGGANGSLSISGSGGGGGGDNNSSTITDSKATLDNFVGHEETRTVIPAGKDQPLSAAVRLPMSYFPAAFKVAHPSVKNPSDADLEAFTKMTLASIHDQVKLLANIKSDAAVNVATYADLPPDMAAAMGPSMPSATLTTVSGHAKEIALAVLAIVSLFLMASMVRKAGPGSVVMPQLAGSTVGSVTLGSDDRPLREEGLVGEAIGTSAALDGMELDEEEVRTQQMLDQVSTMVKENPDGAASLVKRWLSRP